MTHVIATDARYRAARETDQSGQRGWDFSPATPRRRAFAFVTALQFFVCAGVVACFWIALS